MEDVGAFADYWSKSRQKSGTRSDFSSSLLIQRLAISQTYKEDNHPHL